MSTALGHPVYVGLELALLGDATHPTVAELARCRLYADQLPPDPHLPAIRYVLVADTPHQRLGSGESFTAELQVDVYTGRLDRELAWRIDAAVRRALDRVDLAVTGFGRVHCLRIGRGLPFQEHPYYRVMSRYRLMGNL